MPVYVAEPAYLHWLAKESLLELERALPTATDTQKWVWQYDIKLHIENAGFGDAWPTICLVNTALHHVRYKGESIPQAFLSARAELRKRVI